MTTQVPAANSRRIHQEAIVINGMTNSCMSREYLETMLEGGLTAEMIPVSISTTFRTAIDKLSALLKLVDENQDKAIIIRSADDILKAKREGKVGLILVLEDTRQIEDDLDLLRVFRELGIRRMQLVYTVQNSMGCGKGERHDSGLSKLGVQAIERMEQLGILIDLCHCGDKTLAEAMQVVKKPVVLSHTNVRGGFNDPNNMTDEQLEMVAQNGGVVGICGVPSKVAKANPTIDQFVDHVDHVVKKIGVDHAGIGLSAFEGYPPSFYEEFRLPGGIKPQRSWSWPEGIDSVRLFPNLTQKLLERGYSEGDTRKVMGGNFVRVFREACG